MDSFIESYPNTALLNLLTKSGIEIGTIAVEIPFFCHESLVKDICFVTTLPLSPQMVLVPEPSARHFTYRRPETIKSLKDRIHRDKLDAIRYNRLYIMLYSEGDMKLVADCHDFSIVKNQDTKKYVVTDHRKEVKDERSL